MPRPPRLLLSHSFYHIITRGNNRNVVFKAADDYDLYLKLVRKYKKLLPFNLYHYCLMPNHTHFLISTKKAADFSSFMKRINLAYFHYFNKKYGWNGHFWQDRFRSQPVGKDEYFIQCGKYIELNPLRAGLSAKPKDYPYSSYSYYGFGKEDSLITTDFLYEEMGRDSEGRRANYRKLIIDEYVTENYKSKIWGSANERYQEQQKITRKLKNR